MTLLALVGALTACGDARDERSDRAVTPPAPSVVTGSARPVTPFTGPAAAPRLDPVPPIGSVRAAEGPFSDAVRLTALRLRRGREVGVTGRLGNRLETNPVLSLVVRVDFYDARGRYLTSGEQSFAGAGRDELEPITEALRFDVRPDSPSPTTATAVVSVPSFVPE